MATNNLLNVDDKKILAEENKINDRNFQQFHKKVFDEMRNQAIFLACKIMNALVMVTLKTKLIIWWNELFGDGANETKRKKMVFYFSYVFYSKNKHIQNNKETC